MYGRSVTRDMASVRGMVGICPQQNVLWDKLTPREHLELFSALKGAGVSPEDIEQSLEDVGLTSKADSLSEALSGGQKRKLSVAIAFIGDPRVVYLDEQVVVRSHTR